MQILIDCSDHLVQVADKIWVSADGFPSLRHYNDSECWRLLRLAQAWEDMRRTLPKPARTAIIELFDHKGQLTVSVHPEIGKTDLARIRLAVVSAWQLLGESEVQIDVLAP